MEDGMEPDRQVYFAPFRLDLRNQCVWRGARAIVLPPKVFSVFRYLVEHAGRLVTKDELLNAVWPETLVTDASLKVCIREIRKALGDRPQAPRFIETMHRRGYRFIARISAAVEGVSPSPAWLRGPGGERPTPLVGREEELQTLHRCLAKALHGDRQLVLVTGEPGIGKTALVETFLREIPGPQRWRIARGQCLESHGVGDRYLPVLEAFSQLCRDEARSECIPLLGKYAPQWLEQISWMRTDTADGPRVPQRLPGPRGCMLRELAEAVDAVTAERPLLLVLEDLHWCDYDTLDVLAALAQRAQPARLLLIGTYRPVEVILGNHPLKGVKQELHVHERCVELPLVFLTEKAVAEYLARRCPGNCWPPALAQLLHERTEGNPFFLVHIVEDLLEQGVLVRQETGWDLRCPLGAIQIGIPATVRELIEKQLDRLSADEHRLVEVASAAGMEFSASWVAAVLEQDVTTMEDRCEDLARRTQFVQPAGICAGPDGTAASYRFRHVLYRDVLHQGLGEVRRARLQQAWKRYEQATAPDPWRLAPVKPAHQEAELLSRPHCAGSMQRREPVALQPIG